MDIWALLHSLAIVDNAAINKLFEEPPYCSPEWLHQFAFPPTVQEGSSPTPVVSCLVNFSHSDRCEVISHCGFDLHVPDAEWW